MRVELSRKLFETRMDVIAGIVAANRVGQSIGGGVFPAATRSVGEWQRQKLKTSCIEPGLHKTVYASSSDVDMAVQQPANEISTDLLAT